MKKTLLALLLVLCMLVTFTAFTASAEETEPVAETASGHTHCVCGGSAVGVGDHTECGDLVWTPLSEALEGVGLTMDTADFGKLSSGNYYLDGDVTVANDSYFTKKQQMNICLNGHSISVNATGTDGKAQGAFGYIQAGAQLSICDCSGVQDADGNWSWSGTITGGTRSYGGVFATNANSRGYIYGGNYVGTTGTSGVVFNVCKDGYTAAGGTSTSDTSLYSELHIYNGHITGGKASNSGGVINVWHNANVYIYGGTITGGEAKNKGGNICFADGTYVISGGVITGGEAATGDDIYCAASSKLTVSGDVTIGDVYVAAGSGNFTIDALKDSVGISNTHTNHCVCGGHAVGKGTHTECTVETDWIPWGYLSSERTSLPTTAGNYYLVSNLSITAGKDMPAKNSALSTEVNLCLNNHTISLSRSGRINVRAAVSITDCGTEGKITTTSTGSYGGIFYGYNGSYLTLYTGTYDASKAGVADGGVAHIGNDGAAYADIYGGTFKGATLTLANTTSVKFSKGGVFSITVNSVVNMYDGELIGGDATAVTSGTAQGGCVALYSGTLNMYGGSITGGKNHSVYIRNITATYLTVGGDAVIDNLYVGGSKTFTTQEDFTGSIGLTVSSKGHVVTTAKDAEQAQRFTSVEAGYSAKYNNVFGVLVDNHAAHCVCGGHGVGMGEHSCDETAVWMPWGYKSAEKTTLPSTSGNYYLVSDITVSKSTSMAATVDINLCLNGKNINSSGTDRIWAVRKTFGLTDCGTTADWGTVSSQYSGSYGGLLFIYENAEVNLYAGQLDASNAKPAQGGVALIGNSAAATMNIYNAKLIGATLNTTLGKEPRGGVLYLIAGSTLNIYGGEITGGTAALGGGIMLLQNCTLNMYGGEITGGTANFGGNLYATTGANVVVKNVTFTNGLAHTDAGEAKGGNIYAAADIEIIGCTITGGRATSGVTDAEGTFTPGDITSGGNIYAVNKLTVTGCTISDGAACHGGNIRANGETTLTNCTISGGLANLKTDGSDDAGNGGNLYATASADATIDNCTFIGGAAVRAGSVAAWGKAVIIDTTITGGHAELAGGNLMTYNNGSVTLRGSTVISGGTTDGDGGNIRLASAAGKVNTIEDGVQVDAGTAADLGDCIYLTGGTLKLIGNPVIAGLYAVNNETAYGLDVSELNCTQPIALEVAEMGVFADSAADTSAMFQPVSAIEEVRYDSAAQKLFTAWIEQDHIYVDATNGDDGNLGTQDAPVKTTPRAMNAVKDNGTIHLVGTVNLGSWSKHNKTFTITGDELVTPKTRVYLYDHVTFKDLVLTMPLETSTTTSNLGSYYFYCNGYTTVFEEDVSVRYLYNETYMTDPYQQVTYTDADGNEQTVYATAILYGGAPNDGIEGTNLTVLSGIWGRIYGGCNGKNMTGDVHLTVGGKVNEGVDYVTIGHSDDKNSFYRILGGSRNGNITGTVYMNVTGGTHVSTHGGSEGTCSVTAVELTVTGGTGMALYGAGRGGAQTIDNVNFYYEGGTFEQVFGGALSQPVTGNVNLYVTGGNIPRRLYGGCYNGTKVTGLFNFQFSASNQVTGKINLYIGSGANITCDLKEPGSSSQYDDRSIYGHSRYNATSSDAELASIIFMDQAAYTKYKDMLKYHDSTMGLFMSGVTAADYVCYMGTSAMDNVITIGATEVEDHASNALDLPAATATLNVEQESYQYRGEALTPATVSYSEGWTAGDLEIVYTDNNTEGTATATITLDDVSATVTFQIVDDSVVVMIAGEEKSFYSLQDAIGAVPEGSYLKMLSGSDENVTVSKDLYLDLNGHNLTGTVTVEDGFTLYGMDSTTDDYDCTEGYGTIAKVDGQVAHNFKTSVTGSVRRYVTHTTTEGVVSFHRFYVGITSMTLRPGVTGVGYKATFAGDAVVKSMVEEYGYNLWVDGYEEHAFKGTLTAEQFAAAKNVVALLLKNFDVANFSQTPVHATAYIKLNGQTVTTASYYYTLKELVEHIAADVSGYKVAQMEPLQKMCKAYETVMEGWTNIANILNWKAPEA